MRGQTMTLFESLGIKTTGLKICLFKCDDYSAPLIKYLSIYYAKFTVRKITIIITTTTTNKHFVRYIDEMYRNGVISSSARVHAKRISRNSRRYKPKWLL